MDKLNHDKPMRPFPGEVYDQSDDTRWPRCPRRSESTVPGSQSRILWRPGPRIVKVWQAGKSLKIYRFSKVPIDTWLPTFGHFICFTLTSPFTRCTAVLIILRMVLCVDFVDTEIPNDLPVSLVQRHKCEGSIPEAQPGSRQLLGIGWYGSYTGGTTGTKIWGIVSTHGEWPSAKYCAYLCLSVSEYQCLWTVIR